MNLKIRGATSASTISFHRFPNSRSAMKLSTNRQGKKECGRPIVSSTVGQGQARGHSEVSLAQTRCLWELCLHIPVWSLAVRHTASAES